MLLPGYDGLRVPARFAMLATFCLSVAAGLSIARLHPTGRPDLSCDTPGGARRTYSRRRDGSDAARLPPPPRTLLPPGDATVLELPADDARVNVAAMYRAMEHRAADRQRLLGLLAAALHDPVARAAPRRCVAAAHARCRTRPHDCGQRRIRRRRRLQEAGRGRARHRTVQRDERRDRVPLPAQPPGPLAVGLGADRVPAARRRRPAADCRSHARPQIVRAVTFNLRWRYQELGERLRIDRSDDGQVVGAGVAGMDRRPGRDRRDSPTRWWCP